nr:Ig-like domain-containing protein [Desulfobacteraceae bacterium]
MKRMRCSISLIVVLLAILVTHSTSIAAIWTVGNSYDSATIDSSGISPATNFPYGVTDWSDKYAGGLPSANIYHPLWREWFWYRIGTTGKQTSFDKLPVTGTQSSDFSTATLVYTAPSFTATVGFTMGDKAAPSYNSSFIKTITIKNITSSALDYHLYTYSDLDISLVGNDNIVIVKGERAIQTGFEGRTLIQTSTLKPSHYDIDTTASSPGSILDSLENGTDPLILSDFAGPFPESGDMQFVYQYDLNIPANGSVTFTVTDKIATTNPMTVTSSQVGGSCADYGGNIAYNICIDNMANTVAATNVVVTADINADNTQDSSGSIAFVSATNGGLYNTATKTIGWEFPSVAAGAQQCIQATVNVNTTKAFNPVVTIYSDETYPAASLPVTTPLCNYPPSVNSATLNSAKTGVQYVYQITAIDVENDPLTYTLVQAPPGMAMSPTGRISWIPTSQQGNASYPVGVDISDGHSVIHYTFSIYVQWQNQAPGAPAQQTANTPVNTPFSYQVLATDPDNQVLTFTTTDALPAGLTLSSSGLLSGTPTVIGTYTVNITVADPSQATVMTKLIITVAAVQVNNPPTATSQSVSTSEDSAKAITLTGSDADGDALTYTVVTQPAHGTLSGTAPNLTYTPAANYSGSDSFTFSVNDGTVSSSSATVSITVTAVNDAPVAAAQTVGTTRNVAKAVSLSATDADGDALTYTVVTQPAHGTLSGTAPNLTYTPATGYSGSDSFTFKANDGKIDSNTATVSINITFSNVAPTATSQSVSISEDSAKAITLTGSDADGDALTYTVVTQPAHGTLSGTAPNLTY